MGHAAVASAVRVRASRNRAKLSALVAEILEAQTALDRAIARVAAVLAALIAVVAAAAVCVVRVALSANIAVILPTTIANRFARLEREYYLDAILIPFSVLAAGAGTRTVRSRLFG